MNEARATAAPGPSLVVVQSTCVSKKSSTVYSLRVGGQTKRPWHCMDGYAMTAVPPHAGTLLYNTLRSTPVCSVAYVLPYLRLRICPSTPVRNENTFCMSCATGWPWRVGPPVDPPVEHDGDVVMTACVYAYAVRWVA